MDSASSNFDWEECLEEFSENEIDNREIFLMDNSQLSSATDSYSPDSPQRELSMPLQSMINEEKYYLHQLIYRYQVQLLSEFLSSGALNLQAILNWPDYMGSTPLMLAVKLCTAKQEYLSIVHMLLQHGCDARIKDKYGWTPIDEAVYQNNRELVNVLFDHLYSVKSKEWTKYTKDVGRVLKKLPDFYLEFKWQFNSNLIPFVSSIAPHDTCKIWKVGKKLRMDTTFISWKKLKSKRRPMSSFFNGCFWLANHSKRILVNPLEPLDTDEQTELINDILKAEPVQGNFSIKKQALEKVTNWRGQPVSKKIGLFSTEKHKLKMEAYVCIKKRKGVRTFNYEKETDDEATPKPVFDYQSAQETVPKNVIQKTDGEANKKMIVSCWISKEFPLNVKQFIEILNLVSNVNPALSKLKQFLDDDGFLAILPQDAFPIKVEVPVSFSIRTTLQFKNFKHIDKHECQDVFELPEYTVVSRKEGQKTMTCPKKRLFLANFFI